MIWDIQSPTDPNYRVSWPEKHISLMVDAMIIREKAGVDEGMQEIPFTRIEEIQGTVFVKPALAVEITSDKDKDACNYFPYVA